MVVAPPRLGPRLAAVARHVLPGEPFADVGADHALLAMALVADGRVPRAIAVDRLAGPLEAARGNIERYGLADRIAVRSGDGLAALARGEVATVAIAGVGARGIRGMLERVDPGDLGVRRLVLQPQTEPLALQDWLAARWGLAGMVMVQEFGRVVAVYWVDVPESR